MCIRHQGGAGERGDVERARVLTVDQIAGAAQMREVGELLRRHDASVAARGTVGRAAMTSTPKCSLRYERPNQKGTMSKLRFNIAMSLDGFIAGPNQSVENPLGEGGMQLHEWAFALEAWRRPHGREGGEVNASTEVVERSLHNVGATVMGRNMFGGEGAWEEHPWDGWWGDDPPFHTPVFIVTHHAREPVRKQGGTTFTFVTDGIESALEQARKAADGKDVSLGGGASIAQQYLAAGLIDELQIHLVPILLGSGARLLDDLPVAEIELECTGVVEAPGVTHLSYRVARKS